MSEQSGREFVCLNCGSSIAGIIRQQDWVDLSGLKPLSTRLVITV